MVSQGKGISRHHVQATEEVGKFEVTASHDWAFVNSADNDSDESRPPTVVVRDNHTLAICASLRDSKDFTDHVVEWACCNLRDSGHTGVRITLKQYGRRDEGIEE